MRAETSIGEGSGEAQKIFIFLGLEMRILVHSPVNLSVRVWAVIRPIPVLRSVKKDRNGVPVVKKRTGTAFRCVPVSNEPCCGLSFFVRKCEILRRVLSSTV